MSNETKRSFYKGETVLTVEEVNGVPIGTCCRVLFSGMNPWGLGHRTLVVTESGDELWLRNHYLKGVAQELR